MDIHQFTQKMGKIYCSSGVCKFHNPFAGQRFKGNKQVHYATATVLVILPFHASRLCWDASFLNQLPVRFIQADYRAQRVVRLLVYIQNILHPSYKFCSRLGDAPFLLLPRLKFVFFSVSITAVSEILSTTPKRTSSSAISCNVHRSRPSGASEQAMAMICASTRPSTFLCRLTCSFRPSAASTPPVTNRFAIWQIVWGVA